MASIRPPSMGQKVSLLPATAENIPLLAEFLGELFSLEQDFTPDLETQAVAIAEILNNPEHAAIYIIRVGDEAIGMVALHLSISTAEGGWVGRIEDFYIKPEFRRQGFGEQAIKQVRAISLSKGLLRLTLGADKDNAAALSFYQACGFAEMNLLTLKYIDSGEKA